MNLAVIHLSHSSGVDAKRCDCCVISLLGTCDKYSQKDVILTRGVCWVFQDRKMPPKRIAKRRSPPEDALPKSKKVKGKRP